jgi:uncharacterized protein
MKLRGGAWSFDSRDLMRAQCPHCTKLSVARELKLPQLQALLDSFYERPDNLPIRYGNRFEESLEQELLANLGDLIQRPESSNPAETQKLMLESVPVIYQGSLKGGSGSMVFSGRPDFLLRSDYRFEFTKTGLTARPSGNLTAGYTAWDAKLSKTPKPEYQVQVGLYVDVLETLGLNAPGTHGLIQGSRETNEFASDALLANMKSKRSEYLDEVAAFIDANPTSIGDCGELICTATSYCDICEYPKLCQHQRHKTNSLQLVAGISKAQVVSLRAAGVNTVRELGEFTGSTQTLSKEKVTVFSRQAKLQQHTYDTGEHVYEVKNRAPLTALPEESKGDVFFDLEGFVFSAPAGGLEYLFGYLTIDSGSEFHWSWADNRTAEKESFEAFMRFLLARLVSFPDLKVYHYANYELAALRRLGKRFNSFIDEVERLISDGVFVDLYLLVKAALVLSQESYSIKKLENYYEFERTSSVKEALGSMDSYESYLEKLESDPIAAETLKRQVLDYNRDDCVSTLALTRWLRTL